MNRPSVGRCLVVGGSRNECAIVRDSLGNRFSCIDSLWLLRQLQSSLFLGLEETDSSARGSNFADQYDLIIFLGYPSDGELESWELKDPAARFAAFEWHSALQSALLMARCRVVNRGLLMRNNGYNLDVATTLRCMERIGWPVANRMATWKDGEVRRGSIAAVDNYRLWVTNLTHTYETYGALRFPALYGIDRLIRLTQDWLSSESLAGCELWIAATTDGVVLTSASTSVGFLGIGVEDVNLLVEGMTS